MDKVSKEYWENELDAHEDFLLDVATLHEEAVHKLCEGKAASEVLNDLLKGLTEARLCLNWDFAQNYNEEGRRLGRQP